MLMTGLRMPNAAGSFLVCGFDLKQTHNTIVGTVLYQTVHMSVHWWRPYAALVCVTFSHLVSSHCSAS